MTRKKRELHENIFPSAREDAATTDRHAGRYSGNAYRLAFADTEFLLREELRPVRFQLELLKPDLIQQEHGIDSTVVIFGSARHVPAEQAAGEVAAARGALQASPRSPGAKAALARAERRLHNSRYYEEARKLGTLITRNSEHIAGCRLVVVTGGGPGIMEAANRGAHDVGARSIGLNIILPMEQRPNPYISPELCFQFHYFAIRKMHFLLRAQALVAFPGGYGTLDELFETLTLIQTRKVKPVPVLLFGEAFWRRIVNFEALVEEGTISPEDLSLFHYVETAEDAWQHIARALKPGA